MMGPFTWNVRCKRCTLLSHKQQRGWSVTSVCTWSLLAWIWGSKSRATGAPATGFWWRLTCLKLWRSQSTLVAEPGDDPAKDRIHSTEGRIKLRLPDQPFLPCLWFGALTCDRGNLDSLPGLQEWAVDWVTLKATAVLRSQKGYVVKQGEAQRHKEVGRCCMPQPLKLSPSGVHGDQSWSCHWQSWGEESEHEFP